LRITSSMISSNYLYNLNGNLNRLSKYLEQESTGRSINRISDNPVKTTQSLSARNKLSGITRYKENLGIANNWLTETEEAISDLNEIIQDAYEKTVGASTGTVNESDLRAIAEEIAALRDEVLSTANSTFGSSYLFAGYNTTGTSSGVLPYKLDSKGDLYYNGINMSNEASVDAVNKAAKTVAEALGRLADADTVSGILPVSSYNRIIDLMSEAIGAAGEIASAAERTTEAARDIASSADIDAATEAGLTAAAETLGSSYDALSNEIINANNALAIARNAASAAAEAYAALEKAQASGDEAAISEAQNAYNEAVSAAEAAAAEVQAASPALLSAASATANLIDDGDDTTATDVKSIIDSSAALADASAALDAQNADVLRVQVSSGQTMEVAVAGTELLGRGDENLYIVLDCLYKALTGGADASSINDYISRLQDCQSRILALQAEVGAKLGRIDTLSARYEANIINYKKMKSDAEDADLAEVITNYATAKTVYNSALSAGSEIIRTSLLDFLK
jgi:flagellar hook-associated protein 3 FlgL